MKTFSNFFILISLILNSCSSRNDNTLDLNNYAHKIMPLGASRVEGRRPEYDSFRYELWKKLKEEDFKFDFIGTQTDSAFYPSFNNSNFDINHEGQSGWTSKQILDNISLKINQTALPDIVLFSSPGGNDAILNLPYNNTTANINGIIDTLQKKNPNILIIIEQLAPLKTDFMSQQYITYFKRLQQDVLVIANNKTTTNSKVIGVDMFSSFKDSYLADGVHYNNDGAKFIANKYYGILKHYLNK